MQYMVGHRLCCITNEVEKQRLQSFIFLEGLAYDYVREF